jgi:Xaa-Pro aminopeptidase
MVRARLDALLVTSETNYAYFTGHDTPAWAIKSRPMAFLLPLEAEPVLITAMVAETAAMSPVTEILGYDGFEDAARKALSGVMQNDRLTRGRIGCEFGVEQRLGLPFDEFRKLQAEVPDAEWLDASTVLWELRLHKSPAEVVCMRRAAKIQSEAYRQLLPRVHAGMKESELHRIFVHALVDQGVERPGYVAMHSGEGNYRRVSSWPTDRVLAHGDLWFIDSGARYRGYWTDFGRTVAVGKPSREQRDYYHIAYSAMHAALEIAGPGVRVSELRTAADRVLQQHGIHEKHWARIGHGIGLDLTEPPSVLPTDDHLLEPGMVLAIEPRIDMECGHFQTEEDLVITDEGYELLSEPQNPSLPEND